MKYLKLIIIILIIFSGFSFIRTKKITIKDNPVLENTEETKIETILNNLTLEEKIGQMLIIDYRKNLMDSKLEELLTTIKPGGFIFFKENLQEYNEAKKFINDIKNTADIPLFLSIDEEGGRVDRFQNLKNYSYPKIPDMYSIGLENDPTLAYQYGLTIGNILNEFNLNMDFAPVLDVYSNPENTVIGNRSFSSNPKIVANLSISLAQGLMAKNIIPVYKHFPGHGDTKTDSHYSLPIITKSYDELKNLELIPFVNAIKNNAEVIMIGHLALPLLTQDNTPASLSKTIITDILCHDLGYNNLVITDALNMKALTDNYSPKEIYELAINAGVNILLMPENPEEAISLIKELINESKISEEKINTSVSKILKLKAKYGLI